MSDVTARDSILSPSPDMSAMRSGEFGASSGADDLLIGHPVLIRLQSSRDRACVSLIEVLPVSTPPWRLSGACGGSSPAMVAGVADPRSTSMPKLTDAHLVILSAAC